MENLLSVKSVENHFTYMLGISDLDCFKKTVGSKAWDSVMLSCTERFMNGESSSPLEPFTEDESPAPHRYSRRLPLKKISIMAAALGMALCLLTGACLPKLYRIITEGDTFTRVAAGIMELPDAMGENTFQSLREAAEHYGLENVAPAWVPANYSLDTVGSNDEDGYSSIYAWYVSDSDERQGISIRIVCYQQAESMVEKYEMEAEGGEERFTSGVQYFLTRNRQNLRAVWVNGSCLCSISGPVSDSELEQMIKSTKR